jgi:hypothetical protein
MKKLTVTYKSVIELLPFRVWGGAVFVVNAIVIVIVLLIRDSLPPVVPLFYGKPYGSEQLTTQGNLIAPPVAALVISIVNTAINLSFEKDEFLEKVLFGSMIAVTLLSAITVIKIIFLVGNI